MNDKLDISQEDYVARLTDEAVVISLFKVLFFREVWKQLEEKLAKFEDREKSKLRAVIQQIILNMDNEWFALPLGKLNDEKELEKIIKERFMGKGSEVLSEFKKQMRKEYPELFE